MAAVSQMYLAVDSFHESQVDLCCGFWRKFTLNPNGVYWTIAFVIIDVYEFHEVCDKSRYIGIFFF